MSRTHTLRPRPALAAAAATAALAAALALAPACDPAPPPGAAAPPEPAAAVAPGPAVRVSTSVATRDEVDVEYVASGTVRAEQTAQLASRVAGTLRELSVRAGDPVRAGQVLGRIEAADIEAAARAARAGVLEAEAARSQAVTGIADADAEARVATATFERTRRLAADQVAPPQALDEARARYDSALAHRAMADSALARAESRVALARAQAAASEAQSGYARLMAPFAGRVIERRADPGTFVGPGQVLLVVEQAGALRVDVAVDEARAASVALGDEATVELAGAAAPVVARVVELVPAIDPASRAFVARLALPAEVPGAELRPGMFARARFRVGHAPRLEVPASALSPLGPLDRVFVVDGGRARLRLVTVGARRDTTGGARAEILSGLDPGERVVLEPPRTLRDADALEVLP